MPKFMHKYSHIFSSDSSHLILVVNVEKIYFVKKIFCSLSLHLR